MIELPRAALRSAEIAEGDTGAQFFSFGTNDLTQTTLGLSRDDAGPILEAFYPQRALTVATGFVVDDAIVVLENISRHIEDGMRPREAVLRGAREVGFTVLSISVSLVAVFIPLLFMGGIIGRLFREFAVTMSVAVMISLVISLTTAPMLAALLLKGRPAPNRFTDFTERLFGRVLRQYARSLDWALANRAAILVLFAGTVALNVFLMAIARASSPSRIPGRCRAAA
jgi:multidrug efflux pump subunit AcrB